MTRKEALKSLLKAIFGTHTLSADGNCIVKDNSVVSNCNYTPNSFSNIKDLFDIVFWEANPQIRHREDTKDFDRVTAINNAEKYLNNRGIFIPSYYLGKAKTEKIYDIIVNRFLYNIVVATGHKNKKEAVDHDITLELHKLQEAIIKELAIENTVTDFSELLDGNYAKIEIQADEGTEHNEELKYSDTIYCSELPVFQALKLIRDFRILLPTASATDEDVYKKQDIFDILCSGERYMSYPVFSFKDTVPFEKVRWFTYLNKYAIQPLLESGGLAHSINSYRAKIRSAAQAQVEKYVSDELKQYYEETRSYLEKLLSSIIEVKLSDIDFYNQRTKGVSGKIHYLLFETCSKIFFDFGYIHMTIEEFYKDDMAKGYYITFQNLVVELTDLISDNIEVLAKNFKSELTTPSFRKHRIFIKKAAESEGLNNLIKFEKDMYAKYPDLFSFPTSISEYFSCIRKNTFYSFQSALYKYYDAFSKQKNDISKSQQ